MSGGSFNYLCHCDVDDLLNRISDIDQMAEALSGYPDGEAAAKDTQELLAHIKTFQRRTEVLLGRLEPLWRSVEWHHSGDTDSEAVSESLKKYYA